MRLLLATPLESLEEHWVTLGELAAPTKLKQLLQYAACTPHEGWWSGSFFAGLQPPCYQELT